MNNPTMPEGREYVVVTRALMVKSTRYITHAYGPYGQAKAKSVKSNFKRQAREEGYELEVSVCHVLDVDAANAALVEGERHHAESSEA